MSYINTVTATTHHTKHQETDENQAVFHDVSTYLEWHAPGRPFKPRGKGYFMNIFLIMMAVEIILFLFAQYLLMVVILSLVFLSCAMAIVPPHDFHYKITTEGILIEDNFFIWEEIYDFFFLKHHGKEVLYITTKDFLSGELKISLGDITVEEIKSVLLPYLPYREYVKPTFMEKSGNWLEENFPLERA